MVVRSDLSTMGEIQESTRRLGMSGKAATGVLLNAMSLSRRSLSASKYGQYRYAHYNYESILPEEQ
jgi:tyrosine-protein kinase Etk/Wzc